MLSPQIKSLISIVCYHSNLRNLIFVGSMADYIHYSKSSLEPIKPKDLDIICTSLQDFGELRKVLEFSGPFEEPVYNSVFPHTQYYFELLGVRVDVFVATSIEAFSNIKTEAHPFYGHQIQINTKEQSISNHQAYIKMFEGKKDSMELYRLQKHSKRLAFYNMIDKSLL